MRAAQRLLELQRNEVLVFRTVAVCSICSVVCCAPKESRDPQAHSPGDGGSNASLNKAPSGLEDALPFEGELCRQLYKKTSDYMFAEVADDADGRARWKRLSEQEVRDRSASASPVSNAAGVTKKDGWVLVSMSTVSDAGEWIEYVDMCFDPEGHLNEVHGRFNTFSTRCSSGGVTRETLQVFDESGTRTRVATDERDLKTSERVDCGTGSVDAPLYLRLEDLPFFPF